MRLSLALALLISFALALPTRAADTEADVVIYGGTPAGIAAACAAADRGRSVLLIEPYQRIGGLITSGLCHADFRTFEGLTGSYLDFAEQVEATYAEKYGADSEQALGCFHGTHAEPSMNHAVFSQMLKEREGVRVWLGTRVDVVESYTTADGVKSIARLHCVDRYQRKLHAAGKVFIDATYEGDLMAKAGVEFHVGREARSEYDESLAPEVADGQVQGYNFRLTMTTVPENRVRPTKPEGYSRAEFAPLLPLIEQGKFESVFVRWSRGIYKAQKPPLPNGKYDINDVSHGLVRLSLPDINNTWPGDTEEERQKLYDEHVRQNVGLLYFLQNDDAVPEKFRKEAREWGFCRDEHAETNHIPEQLYVREARRMVGVTVFTENHTAQAEGDARAVHHPDAIAMGDYGPNCHGTNHEGPRIGGRHTGEFYKRVAPYQIPYGVLLPKRHRNLLVPTACSSSHVGFCALRLEPIWMSLGQAAGIAADLAIANKTSVQDVNVEQMQDILHKAGAATIYVSDVPRTSKLFRPVQWWGQRGGLHGLEPPRETYGERGKLLTSQYYEAFPGHAVGLDQPLDDALRTRWMTLAEEAGLSTEKLEEAKTRGEFIGRAYRLSRAEGE